MGFFGGSSDNPASDDNRLTDEELAVLEKVARKAVDRGWTVPSILFLESVKPLNYIASQALVFFEPIVQTLLNLKDYDTFRTALERRESVEVLIVKIEELDVVAQRREKAIKKFLKQEKKKWNWYQRYLGIFTPKVDYPEEVLNPPEPGQSKKAD